MQLAHDLDLGLASGVRLGLQATRRVNEATEPRHVTVHLTQRWLQISFDLVLLDNLAEGAIETRLRTVLVSVSSWRLAALTEGLARFAGAVLMMINKCTLPQRVREVAPVGL